jgi:hypothetical protein
MAMRTRWAICTLVVFAGVTLVPSGAAWARATRPSEAGRFYGTAATSARNAWAVGLQGGNVLIMHYSGGSAGVYRWRVSFTRTAGFLYGVAATSVSNAWAVGGTNWFTPQTLAEHWNGHSWSQVATPTPGGTAYFEGIAANSPQSAWAVGAIGDGPAVDGSVDPLIEHWNGQSWSQADYPEPAQGQFAAVAAISADDVWAVGHIGSGAGTQPLIEHWNGEEWAIVPSNIPADLGVLDGVAATGPDDVWAVGFLNGSTEKSLIEHWNGTEWAVVPSPTPTGDAQIKAVAAASSDDAWAVGYTRPTSCDPLCGTTSLHWNGSRWAVVPTINPPGSGLSVLFGVVAVSAHNLWTVGSYDSWSATLIEHGNGTRWIWHLPR